MNKEEFLSECRSSILEKSKRRRENGRNDELYAVLLSDNDNVYIGKPFTQTNQPQFHFCAERHAINQMQLEESESAGIDRILVAHPVPEGDNTPCYPCGACLDALREFGDLEVISTSYTREESGWTMFESMESNFVSDLYPKRYEDPWKN